ncbi:MAG: HTH domain-containing protein [Opitutaceae bacterium]|nr:HTH domain-containing protein [Opitutaceae bacterium]
MSTEIPSTPDSRLQRLIEIVKLLQDPEQKQSLDTLAQKLHVTRRTIERDMEALRTGIEILGTFVEMQTSGHGKRFCKSSIHPLVLMLNLTEIFTLLKLLDDRYEAFPERNGEREMVGVIYQTLFDGIYGQLTEYARKIAGSHLNLANTYAKRKAGPAHYRDEQEAVKNRQSDMLHYLFKSRTPVTIRWTDRDGSHEEHKARLIKIGGGGRIGFRLSDGKEKLLSYEKVALSLSEYRTSLSR